ncbi:excinuclease ABC subunit UvrA [Streptomyces coeruleorubidus]|uniref:UvrABC system protein A n=1 Tax=Streptomyces coeruleorubidus TaxID=116188 RepID=A0A5J6I1Y5_STRC4|nr:excinuclease ABC subunit UvrA [Streptomyces coeruleorubidus]QEV26038.1 excinuclease ABC subunit UvrA [Streptomyces coeruleorubidus]GGT77526.1 UvrABC system protein A [Streptomyces coeruleorubidus]
MTNRIVIKGARQHNLRDVSVDLPRDALIVFTGVSGSGKSSLAFDTIFAEGQRRYVESLSAYARQFLGQLDKPDVDAVEGLSPAIAIDQKTSSRNPRSTVGTITEVYDHLRLLYARIGHPHCPTCGEPVSRQTPQRIVDLLLDEDEGTRFQVLAPVVRDRKGEHAEVFRQLSADGYSRVRVDGTVLALATPPALDQRKKHSIDVVVDRLAVKPGVRQRLTESVETALGLGGGVLRIEFVDREPGAAGREVVFSEAMACPRSHDPGLESLEPRLFSFNAPWGACPACTGLGSRMEVDPSLVVPDDSKSLAEGAIAPWTNTSGADYFTRLLEALAADAGFSTATPWRELGADVREMVLHGADRRLHLAYRNRFGRERSHLSRYEGVIPHIERRYAEGAESGAGQNLFAGYMREVPCAACGGARLAPGVLAVTVGGRSIAQAAALPLGELAEFVRALELTGSERRIAEAVLAEIGERLRFLLDVGLDYLSLDRPAASLSGGEAQRIRLATQIGAGLTGVLYVLDEPSIGLHQRDNQRLIETLKRLRDRGNTVIVVEHDEETLRVADWVVDIGPGAGIHGGRIVCSGTVQELSEHPESLTGAYLSGRRRIALPTQRRQPAAERALTVHAASEHNLRDVTVSFPLGVFTAVTGVSGSGKSTLVNDILHTALAQRIHRAHKVPGRHRAITGIEHVDKVVQVDQSPIGRSPRSNPATYTGVFDHLRKLFAQTPEAKVRGYQPGRFSFNVKGGRCEHCYGDGTITVEMNFLPDVYVPCEVCKGAQYNRETLDVHYKGRSIADILAMTVAESVDFFDGHQIISRHLRTLDDVGLGYVKLGQAATTLSGGEAQRVKLAAELQRRTRGRTLYVLDEPTTGLHAADVDRLLTALQRLVDGGNTVVVIEHNLDVIKSADWLIDMGPEGGLRGGEVIAEGTPEQVAADARSHTGRFLNSLLELERT